MNFTFNGIIPENINYNGTPLNRLQYNGVTVWEKVEADDGDWTIVKNGIYGLGNIIDSSFWTTPDEAYIQPLS